VILFCDLHKAIDCVNHKILLIKLEFYGITAKFLNLHVIKYYLEDWHQKVSIGSNIHSDNISSDCKKITHGVPQGSILVPLLFLIYRNDLLKVLIQDALLTLFAGNTNVIVTDSNTVDIQLNMRVIYIQLNNWFNVYLLLLHLKKKQVSLILKQRTLMRYMVNCNMKKKFFANLSDIKFLGLCLNNTMDWRVHTDHLIPKLSSALHAIRTLKQMIMIYYAYFHSLMTYGIIFGGNSPYSVHIFRLQKTMVRTMTDSKNRDSCKNLLKNLNIFTFITICILITIICHY
jgi:hypothetical protein